MEYKIIRIYRIQGEHRLGALENFRKLDPEQQHGCLREEFAVEDKPKGFGALLKKQILG